MVDDQVTQGDVEALFAHLQQLMDRLPQMQQIDARLAGSELAARVCAAEHEHATCQAEYDLLARQQGEARDRMEAARKAGDEAGAERLFHEYAYLSNQVGLHEGPVANSQAALEEALTKVGVASVEEARAMLLDPEETERLRAQIRDYQDDYARTLAACQSLS